MEGCNLESEIMVDLNDLSDEELVEKFVNIIIMEFFEE